MTKRYQYRGDKTGEYISGVPARDLDDEEYEAMDPELKERIHKTKGSDGELVYKPVTQSSSSSSSASSDKKEGGD